MNKNRIQGQGARGEAESVGILHHDEGGSAGDGGVKIGILILNAINRHAGAAGGGGLCGILCGDGKEQCLAHGWGDDYLTLFRISCFSGQNKVE